MRYVIVALIVSIFVALPLFADVGRLEKDGQEAIQAHVSKWNTLRNDTKTGTKNYHNVSTVSNTATDPATGQKLQYRSISVTCTDGAGTLVPCIAKPNGGTAHIDIPSGQDIIVLPAGTTSMRFEDISSATSKTRKFSTGRM